MIQNELSDLIVSTTLPCESIYQVVHFDVKCFENQLFSGYRSIEFVHIMLVTS